MFIGREEQKLIRFNSGKGRGKDKAPRKRRGLGGAISNRRDKAAEGLGRSAVDDSFNRARKGKFKPGFGSKVKAGLAGKVAADKEGTRSKLDGYAKNKSDTEYKIASSQAKQINQGKSLAEGDKPAAGLLYDRTKGKAIAAKLNAGVSKKENKKKN